MNGFANAHPSCFVQVDGPVRGQRLPNELLRSIFLYCDPATLYTSIRPINRAWKRAVEEELIASHFTNKDWRVGLRVVRKLPPSSLHAQQPQDPVDADPEGIDRLNLLEREGATEPLVPSPHQPQSVVHVIPLEFKSYEADSVSLRFDTNAAWHSLFRVQPSEDHDANEDDHEGEDEDDQDDLQQQTETDDDGAAVQATARHRRRREQAETKACSARLEVDFGLVWRFPDDGQDAERTDSASKDDKLDEAAYWGTPDPENGWLSRFYCSNYDVRQQDELDDRGPVQMLHSTPIVPRTRREALHPLLQRSMAASAAPEPASVPASRDEMNTGDLIWSDEGHEYLSLSLTLGMEFFVRRSARANQLLRRLEDEVVAAEARDRLQTSRSNKGGKKRWGASVLAGSASASGWATPAEVASPPPSRTTASLDARRHGFRTRAQQRGHLFSSSPSPAAEDCSKDSDKSKGAAGKQATASTSLTENDEVEAPCMSGATTPAVSFPAESGSLAVSRIASVAPSRRGGGSVALSSTSGSQSTKANSRRSNSSAPRATFSAKLCRAELMPSYVVSTCSVQRIEAFSDEGSTASAVDAAGWRGGDNLGRGSFRLASTTSSTAQGSWSNSSLRRAALMAGVSSPAVWSWSR